MRRASYDTRQPSVREGLRRSIMRLEARYQVLFLCFLATTTAYVERVGFSIAYTVMAKEAGLDEATKGTVLSAFFWGYAISQVPGGWAAQRFGGQRTLSLSFATWSLASLLTPGSAASVRATIFARVCVGLAQGFIIPAIHTVLSQWVPPHERARAVSLTTSGMYLGSAGAMLALPALARFAGAASLPRFVGALGALWTVLWTAAGREVPHRYTVIPLSAGEAGPGKGRPPAVPWGRMLRSNAVWAIIINNFTFHYAFYVVMNWLPTYFDQVLGRSLSQLGAARTAPYLVMFASTNFGAWLGDALITGSRFTVVGARRAINTIGFWGAALALLAMPMAGGLPSGLFATSCALGLAGLARGGFSVNHMDIAPKYAGVLMGLSNTAGTLAGVVGVALTGWMLERAGRATTGWWQALATAAALCLAGSLHFLAFARGQRLFGSAEDL